MTEPIITLDLHGKRTEEAKKTIDAVLAAAGPGVYRIRIIHGFSHGDSIRRMVWEEYRYGREPRVRRVEGGWNEGVTELVLREY